MTIAVATFVTCLTFFRAEHINSSWLEAVNENDYQQDIKFKLKNEQSQDKTMDYTPFVHNNYT